MKVGILGSGNVAKSLGKGFLNYGFEVMLGTRHASKLNDWYIENPEAKSGDFNPAAEFGEIIILAVKGSVASEVLKSIDNKNLDGKIICDATNPISDSPPVNGVLKFFTNSNESLMEQLQVEFPSAKFVKVFNSVGHLFMVNPQFKDGKPSMFICGNDSKAKKAVEGILVKFGWEAVDMGMAESARAIEPLCILWCIPGFLNNEWSHAFKLIR